MNPDITLGEILYTSFDSNILRHIPGMELDDLVYKNYPDPLNYIDIQEDKCDKSYYNNYKVRNHPRIREIEGLVFYDVKLSELEYASYNFSFFKDTFTGKFHTVYGKVTGALELGVKHSIISKGFPIYLSGELKKTRLEDRSIDLIQYNFNSSNFKIKKLREKAYKLLRHTNPTLVCDYWLHTSRFTDYRDEIRIQLFEEAYHKFYLDFIKPFADNIFSSILVSGYPDTSSYILEYQPSEQDTYEITYNPDFIVGLHNYYDDKTGNCYADIDPDTLLKINTKGTTEPVSRMCVQKNNNNDCEQDNNFNKIDVLDEIFLQMIYQRGNIVNEPTDLWKFDIDFMHNIKSKIDASNLNYFRPSTKLIDFVSDYFAIWLKRYINKNYPNLFISNFITNYIIFRPLKKMSDIPQNDLMILKQLLIIIKILFYLFFRIRFDVELEDCPIFLTENLYSYNFSLVSNEIITTFNCRTRYTFDIPLESIYYDNHNTNMIWLENHVDIFKAIEYAKLYGNIDEVSPSNPDIPIYNINQLIKLLPLPINYLSLKKKYLKYKTKYIILKKKIKYVK